MPFPKRFRACTIVACLALTSLTALAAAKTSFDAIFVFGDSYCDVGNIYAYTGGLKPLSPPYYKGRFSNGPIWVEPVARVLGLPMLP